MFRPNDKIVAISHVHYSLHEPASYNYAAYIVLDYNRAIKVLDEGYTFCYVWFNRWNWNKTVGTPIPLGDLLEPLLFDPDRIYSDGWGPAK